MSKYPSTILVNLDDKLAKVTDPAVRKAIEGFVKEAGTEIRKADLDLLSKINELAQQAAGGPFVPLLPNPLVAGEPSLGTPHPTSDANRTATLVVDTATNTAGVWSAAVTMTGVPTGAKAAWCRCFCSATAANMALAVEAASGYTLSDITSGTNRFKYHGIFITGGATINEEEVVVKIRLDANKQFKWCTGVTNSVVKIGSAIDYEM